jgi:hypothetical protein
MIEGGALSVEFAGLDSSEFNMDASLTAGWGSVLISLEANHKEDKSGTDKTKQEKGTENSKTVTLV